MNDTMKQGNLVSIMTKTQRRGLLISLGILVIGWLSLQTYEWQKSALSSSTWWWSDAYFGVIVVILLFLQLNRSMKSSKVGRIAIRYDQQSKIVRFEKEPFAGEWQVIREDVTGGLNRVFGGVMALLAIGIFSMDITTWIHIHHSMPAISYFTMSNALMQGILGIVLLSIAVRTWLFGRYVKQLTLRQGQLLLQVGLKN